MHSSDGMKAPLLSSHDVPPHVRQPFISLGYRRPLRHPYRLGAAAAAGLFSWHNETLNVWSHLLGLLWALSRLAETLAADGVAPVAKAAVGAFDVSAVAVLAASATAHLFAPVLPPGPARLLWRVDHVGIVVAICGSYVPGIRYGFRCHLVPGAAYGAITAAGLVASMHLTFYPTEKHGRDWLRIAALSFTTGFGLVPLAHFCTFAPPEDIRALVPGLLAMFGFYALGVAFFLSFVPERISPAVGELVGSHALWHVCIVAALWSWDVSVSRTLARDWSCEPAPSAAGWG